ncbi:DUF7344 domain-containing protein [Natrialba sp. SSL1]|uniref:DUF7344 domain-containing protein n=1 Tax=Natrialba sp. SSL1 TaxID=1869245 RepID=UPI0011138772|nr:hypothetical protein [Natrialba sp. SSL1]
MGDPRSDRPANAGSGSSSSPQSKSGSESTPQPLSVDQAVTLLRDPHRRLVLAHLADHERRLTVNDLAKASIDRGYEASILDVPSRTITSVFISLQHTHLPKLADAGLIDYDSARGLVTPTDTFEHILPYLESTVVLE